VSLPDLDGNSRLVWDNLDLGDLIGVAGTLMRTHTAELTLRAGSLTMLTKSLRPLPDKHAGLRDREERYRSRHLDLLTNPDSRAVFEARSRVVRALRRTLDEGGFLEVETPVLMPLAGGAAAKPFLTHHNALDRDLALRIATELHLKRLVVGGLERVYELGRIFRNEGLSTWHNPEFTTLEAYQAYAGFEDMMDLPERLVRDAALAAAGTTTIGGLEFAGPWPRLSMQEAVRQTTGIDFAALDSDEAARRAVAAAGFRAPGWTWGQLLAELFEACCEEALTGPVFITGHPVETSPLARRDPQDPRLTERFELYVAGREIAPPAGQGVPGGPGDRHAAHRGVGHWRGPAGHGPDRRPGHPGCDSLPRAPGLSPRPAPRQVGNAVGIMEHFWPQMAQITPISCQGVKAGYHILICAHLRNLAAKNIARLYLRPLSVPAIKPPPFDVTTQKMAGHKHAPPFISLSAVGKHIHCAFQRFTCFTAPRSMTSRHPACPGPRGTGGHLPAPRRTPGGPSGSPRPWPPAGLLAAAPSRRPGPGPLR
jgi:elongation factor P--beta-lysine ligase